MFKVLGISGSLRESGNTEFLVRHALSLLHPQEFQADFISLRGKDIKPCNGCYNCVEAKRCTIPDDFDPIYQKMVEADGLIIGSPAYYASVHPQLMSLLDRAGFVRLWTGDYFSGKVGGPITVARRTGQDLAFAQLLMWYFINDIIVPGSGYWTVGLAGSRGARDASKDEEGLRHIERFVGNMARVIKALKAANSGSALPQEGYFATRYWKARDEIG
ncbi:MAG: flavodoxin family protein [Firmicutes bacterium]|nr:flavodoxin family protein [Bacillota bacterium]MCL5039981.1 flavodoxin family protein [Bacillota bacterium]